MATIMTNSRPPSGRVPAPIVSNHAHNSLLPVPPRLPFPTSPAMPDRRSRLKRLNMSISSRENASSTETGSDAGSAVEDDVLLSKRAARKGPRTRGYDRRPSRGRVSSASHAAAAVPNNEKLGLGFNVTGNERLHPHLNSMDVSSDDLSVNSSGGMSTVIIIIKQNSSTASKVRHRNIVTPRQHGPIVSDAPDEVGGRQRQRRNRSRQGRSELIRFRLPDISIRQTVSSPQPQGIFLTSLAYDVSSDDLAKD
ncbi:hypothetical protein ElyMa_006510900 [Elysia marginata]|uniref:Uncharacterized protein n=1 Tax=Elysia marginata TaxID=1093978 RepID=A0AAV4I3N6_9GAST|nr:hypothetical protein ElyMa_006510900 [Elysia marginata]